MPVWYIARVDTDIAPYSSKCFILGDLVRDRPIHPCTGSLGGVWFCSQLPFHLPHLHPSLPCNILRLGRLFDCSCNVFHRASLGGGNHRGSPGLLAGLWRCVRPLPPGRQHHTRLCHASTQETGVRCRLVHSHLCIYSLSYHSLHELGPLYPVLKFS